MRRKIKRKNILKPDIKYNSLNVAKFINRIMWDGKKVTAMKQRLITLLKSLKQPSKMLPQRLKYVHDESVVQTTRFLEKYDLSERAILLWYGLSMQLDQKKEHQCMKS
jgi:hypothetical protein